jgi:hypothetical protein
MVYRPAAHARTMKFLGELEGEVAAYWLPTVVGGNFNLVLRAEDKATTMSIGLGCANSMMSLRDCRLGKLVEQELASLGPITKPLLSARCWIGFFFAFLGNSLPIV